MSLLASRVNNFRINSPLDKWETRAEQWGCYEAFVKDTPNGLLSPQLIAQAQKSMGSNVEVPVIKYDGSVSIGSTRSVTIADDENTSALYTVSWTTLAFGFTQLVEMFHNNDIGAQRDFDAKLRKYIYQLGHDLDVLAENELDTAKTQILNDDLGLYSLDTNVVVAPLAQQEDIIGDLNPMMSANDYFEQMKLIGNYTLSSVIRKMSQFGLNNSEDKTIQFMDKELAWSKNISNGIGHKATGYAVNQGSLAFLTRFERESLNRRVAQDGTKWDIETLAGLELPVGTYFYESKGDYSAMGGAATADMTRALKYHFGFAVDVAFITPYNSDRAVVESPIMKFAIATT